MKQKNSLLFVWDFFQIKTLFGLLCLLLASIAHSIDFKPITGADQLPTSSINHIIQRADGFIWMATVEGVSRYDGKNFINHSAIPDDPTSLPNAWVSYLLEDRAQHLWLATAGGLARLNANGISFTNYLRSISDANSIAGNNVTHLFESSDGTLWVGTDRGLSRYRPATDDFSNHYISGEPGDIENNHVNVIGQQGPNHLWIGNEQGLFLFEISTATFQAYELDHPDAESLEVLDLKTDLNHDLWVVTAYHGAFKLDQASNQVTVFKHQADNPNSLVSNDLWSLMG